MNREDIIRLAREAGFVLHDGAFGVALWMGTEKDFERFAALVAAHERAAMMQLFTDPENQPTQHGTVTIEYMNREIASERERCAAIAQAWDETHPSTNYGQCIANEIRSRA